jgi:hypothetical protein
VAQGHHGCGYSPIIGIVLQIVDEALIDLERRDGKIFEIDQASTIESLILYAIPNSRRFNARHAHEDEKEKT